MKKSLVALATLAATGAFAQSSVTITGIMDAGFQSGTSYGQSYTLVGQSGARTTSFQFLGVEDLGGGNKAKFRMEIQPQIISGDGNAYNTNGSGFSAGTVVANGTAQTTGQSSLQSGLTGKGYTYLGAEGSFGEVQFGTLNTASLAAHSNGSGAMYTGIGSGYNVTVGSTGSNTFTRFENAAAYFTPTINGLSAGILYSPGNDSQYGATTGVLLRRNKVQELGAQYINGPMQLNLAQIQSRTSPNEAGATSSAAAASNVTTTRTTVSASYDLTVARLGFTNSAVKDNTGLDTSSVDHHLSTKANMLYVQVPVGQYRLMASTGNRKTDSNTVTALAGKSSTINGFAAEYDLSKRTYVYLRNQTGKQADASGASTVINGAAAAGSLANPNYRLLSVGVSHQF